MMIMPSHVRCGIIPPPASPASAPPAMQPMPSIDASMPHMFPAAQHERSVMPNNIGAGHAGAGGGGGTHIVPLSEPQVLVAGSAQHAGRSMMGRPAGTFGAMHTVVPQGMPAGAPVPAAATALVPAAPTVPVPPKPAAPTGIPVVPSSPPQPKTLTKAASATAVHARLFIAGNSLHLQDAQLRPARREYHNV